MATIKGQNLRVKLCPENPADAYYVAASTNCVCHLALQTQEDTTKDTDDDWIRTEPVALNWDVQVDALVIGNDTDDEQYREGAIAADELQIGHTYMLFFVHTVGAPGMMNRDDTHTDDKVYYGYATLSDLQYTSPNGDHSVARAQFTGVGDLTEV